MAGIEDLGAAGIAVLDAIAATPGLYERLEAIGAALEAGLRAGAQAAGVPITLNRVGSMLTVFFTPEPVTDLESARRGDAQAFARWFHALLAAGIYWPPSPFEAAFLSYALSDADIEAVALAARRAFAGLERG